MSEKLGEGNSQQEFLWGLTGVFGLVFLVAVGLAFLLTQGIARPLEPRCDDGADGRVARGSGGTSAF